MSRYRPPPAKKSPYITPEGARALELELKQLWKVERPKITASVQEAAKNGDRSENGDYIYGRLRLRDIDRRVRYLGKRLDEVVIVDRTPQSQERIYFGAWITLLVNDAEVVELRLVGSDEIDATRGYISIDSPLARALIGKSTGDQVSLNVEGREIDYLVESIRYSPPEITE